MYYHVLSCIIIFKYVLSCIIMYYRVLSFLNTYYRVLSAGGALWESKSPAPHVGTGPEDPSLRTAAQRLPAPPAPGQPRLQRHPEY